MLKTLALLTTLGVSAAGPVDAPQFQTRHFRAECNKDFSACTMTGADLADMIQTNKDLHAEVLRLRQRCVTPSSWSRT